jgi:hypothetical protein
VINPDVEDTLTGIVNVTHEGRIHEAIESVLHALTVTEAQDLEHKQFKESLVKAINDVLPQPYIHQIIVTDFHVGPLSGDQEKTAHEKDKGGADRDKSGKTAPPSSKGAAQPGTTGDERPKADRK